MAALAPATDVEIWLLFGLLHSGCCGLFRNFTFAFFNKSRKFDGPVIRNLDVWRGASNAHGRDWSVDLHVASFRHFAGDKSERTFGQTEEGRIGLPVRVINGPSRRHARRWAWQCCSHRRCARLDHAATCDRGPVAGAPKRLPHHLIGRLFRNGCHCGSDNPAAF